ncbi:hypothetical protein CT0861_02803 [Colletotrichum tofieldiae]|uniref:Uncharacterized protein n=1 Tax=Colletotrichum tofieldiae TaxID=708197 RepID=A0A166N073_9PEZI|nr:hypothetical protein CT0861_02803 [Colletotrichum tofieldiae]
MVDSRLWSRGPGNQASQSPLEDTVPRQRISVNLISRPGDDKCLANCTGTGYNTSTQYCGGVVTAGRESTYYSLSRLDVPVSSSTMTTATSTSTVRTSPSSVSSSSSSTSASEPSSLSPSAPSTAPSTTQSTTTSNGGVLYGFCCYPKHTFVDGNSQHNRWDHERVNTYDIRPRSLKVESPPESEHRCIAPPLWDDFIGGGKLGIHRPNNDHGLPAVIPLPRLTASVP